MTIRKVGPNSIYPTIAAAVAAAAEGDIIRMEAGYTYERAVLTVQNLTVTGGDAELRIDLELGAGIDNVTLRGPANITVWDNAGSNVITGNRGGNQVHVSGGTDVVHGGDGHDELFVDYLAATSVVATGGTVTDGGTNSVTFSAVEFVVISTGSGDDSLTTDDRDYMLRSGGGNDTIAAGGGRNIVEAGAGNDTVTTGNDNDMVFVSEGDDTVTTGGGDDYVVSGAGHDTVKTGGGDDNVVIGGGMDTADAGVGRDLLSVNYGDLETDVTVSIGAGSVAKGYSGLVADVIGNHSVSFTRFEDFLIQSGSGDDDVRVGGGNDTIWGNGGNDVLHAGAGNDDLYGDRDGDRLIGGRGEDALNGGLGADTLIGGRGEDVLTGSLGADVFRFDDLDSLLGAKDLIQDLNEVEDTIDLSRIDADVTPAGDQAFVLVDRFSGAAGEATLRYRAGDDVTRLILDTDGDARADIVIIAAGDQRDFGNFVL